MEKNCKKCGVPMTLTSGFAGAAGGNGIGKAVSSSTSPIIHECINEQCENEGKKIRHVFAASKV